jgi:hypothetical protein
MGVGEIVNSSQLGHFAWFWNQGQRRGLEGANELFNLSLRKQFNVAFGT